MLNSFIYPPNVAQPVFLDGNNFAELDDSRRPVGVWPRISGGRPLHRDASSPREAIWYNCVLPYIGASGICWFF